MMSKIESFIYACLPALLILIFSEVAVYLANGDIGVTMSILGVFYLILIWWLYQYTRVKSDYDEIVVEKPRALAIPQDMEESEPIAEEEESE